MAKDIFHNEVRQALEKEGWLITDDPYSIRLMGVESDIDLGAERLMGAEREKAGEIEKIAVEIKSFIGNSFMKDFHLAVGQFTNYRILLARKETDRTLYLAVSKAVYERRFRTEGIQFICEQANIRIVVFDQDQSTIVLWTN